MSDFWEDAKGVLKAVAPAIGTAIGGPLGGVATRAIAGALLGDENASEEQIEQAIRKASPEQLLQLKKAEQDFKTHMKELDIDLERIAAGDRDSARRRQMETKDKMPAFIALAALAGFFGILACMIFVDIPPQAAQPLAVMLGSLGTLVTQIGAFYFGSSSGSSRKNDIIERIMTGRGAKA